MTIDENNNLSNLKTVNASPTKNFFVEMLTRDIELEDAILDLLDNCVDGVQRTIKNSDAVSGEKPYEGFWAKINFSSEHFKLEDNCGGIPIEERDIAFRMGRPESALDKDKDVYTIGTYGIGMKRAMFKMGRSSYVVSQTNNNCFKVSIQPEWLSSDDGRSGWDLPIEEIAPSLEENGTIIEVKNLRETIKQEFSQSRLLNTLVGKISHHYSYIINKGFSVWVNGIEVVSQPIDFIWDGIDKIKAQSEDVMAPFLYKAEQDGINVELAVGFYRSTPSEKDVDNEMEGKRRSGEMAGWTIICNDRVVVYCDKTRLTGWGDATVPSYHPQFIAISGIVNFHCKDASKLPLTTTKRGIDASSEIYLYIKNYMREGLKLFTSYTNKWKTNTFEEKKRISKATAISSTKVFELSTEFPSEAWKTPRKKGGKVFTNEKKYTPNLPIPKSPPPESKLRRINFFRTEEEIQLVSEYLFDDPERDSSEVGNECFSMILKEAKKNG